MSTKMSEMLELSNKDFKSVMIKILQSQANSYNPSYLGDRSHEDHGSKPAVGIVHETLS
jgi:hypothetical protein